LRGLASGHVACANELEEIVHRLVIGGAMSPVHEPI